MKTNIGSLPRRELGKKPNSRCHSISFRGISWFFDLGNSFLSPKEYDKFVEFYTKKTPRKIEDNFYYPFSELFSNPNILLDNHYISTGLSLVSITPLGAVADFTSDSK